MTKKVATEPAADPFDPAKLRLSSNLGVGIKRLLTTIPVKKPSREVFVRAHPDEAYRLETCVVELKDSNEMFLVSQDLWPELAGESTFGARLLVTSLTRQNELFLWPLRLSGVGGKLDDWCTSAQEALTVAMKSWVRVQANMFDEAYRMTVATYPMREPEWPTTPFSDLLRVAFKNRFIDNMDHPVLLKLRGEA